MRSAAWDVSDLASNRRSRTNTLPGSGQQRAQARCPFEQPTPPLHAANKQIPYGCHRELRIYINIHYELMQIYYNTSVHHQGEIYDLSSFLFWYSYIFSCVNLFETLPTPMYEPVV